MQQSSSCRENEISELGGILLLVALTPHLRHTISSWHRPLVIDDILLLFPLESDLMIQSPS